MSTRALQPQDCENSRQRLHWAEAVTCATLGNSTVSVAVHKTSESEGGESQSGESKPDEAKIIEKPGRTNAVEIRFMGNSGLAYQIVGNYFIPWEERPVDEGLSTDVAYDRMRLAQDDIAGTATIKNHLPTSANMVMVDLGIPPRFDLLSEDLQDYVEQTSFQKSGCLQEFTQTATLAILYFNSIAPGATVTRALSPAGQISGPLSDFPVAGLRILRSRLKLYCASGAVKVRVH
jgi:hypothetical protein